VQASLPAIASSFVGRTDDVDTLSALLDRSDAPIITLTGPGGVGKTRLAVECATANCARYDEGTAFVGLASLRDPAQVIPALAEAVGVRDVGTGAVGDVLRRDLAERSLLLVIDNFEHLMGAADELGALLAAASGVQALVTSREALRVAGEHEFAVEPMNDDDALELFARRASAVRRDFTLDAANEARARAICQQVDRVPLAIELAAARTRLLPLDALLDRLGRRLDFLTGGPRDLPARHQALRDTVEWSYELLDDAERWVFAQLGVFVGSFSLAAARAVLGGDELLVLDQLASLVEKSLLRVEATTGEPRFRMLGMIRDLAVERLDVAEAADPTRERHAAFFRAFSLELGAGVRGPDQAAWLDILGRADEGDAGNVKTALSWYLEHGRLDQCVEMAWALWPAVWVNGRLEQGDALAAIAGADGELAPLARARLLVLAGLFPLWRGEHDTAWAALEEALVLGAALPDDEVVAYATLASAMLAGPAKGEDHAEAYALDGVARCRALGDRWAEAAALNALSWLYVAKDHFEDRAVFDETIAASKACGDQHFAAMAEVNLAEYELARGDVTAAERLLESSAERHRALRIMYSLAYLLDAAARVAVARGDDVLAARLVGAADHRREVVGIGVWGSQLVRRDAMIEGMVVRLGDEAFARAHAVGAALGYGECLDLVPGPD
jgi:predicted ATPase